MKFLVGERVLGFKAKEIGCHSIRLSFTMFLYLQDIRTDRIILQRRWQSDAFLLYICVQVIAFGRGLSNAITHNSNNFFTVSNTDQTNNNMETRFNFDVVTDPTDLRCCNTHSFASNMNNNGPGTNNRRITRPSFFHLHS